MEFHLVKVNPESALVAQGLDGILQPAIVHIDGAPALSAYQVIMMAGKGLDELIGHALMILEDRMDNREVGKRLHDAIQGGSIEARLFHRLRQIRHRERLIALLHGPKDRQTIGSNAYTVVAQEFDKILLFRRRHLSHLPNRQSAPARIATASYVKTNGISSFGGLSDTTRSDTIRRMKRRVVVVSVVSLGVLSGCGALHGSHPISHGMTPTQVKSEVLARLKGWHTVQEQLTEVVSGPNGQKQTYQVALLGSTSPNEFRLDVVPKEGTPYQVVDTGLNTVEYQHGAKHYSVSASNPGAWAMYRILGAGLPSALQASHVASVVVTPKQVVLHMITPIAPRTPARATLWFNLQSNMPSRFVASWKGGSVEETPTQIHINPNISPAAFVFTPPAGVRAQVALTTQGTALDQAQAHVTFPIVLPPSSQNLQLNAVDVSAQAGRRVVLLTYVTPKQSPVVITEEKAGSFTPPAGLSMVSETVGTTTAEVGSLPDGEEMAAVTLQKTLVVIEGPAVAVDNLVNSWTVGSTSPPTSSP